MSSQAFLYLALKQVPIHTAIYLVGLCVSIFKVIYFMKKVTSNLVCKGRNVIPEVNR